MTASRKTKFEIANGRDRLAALELTIESLPLAVGLFWLDGRPVLLNRHFRELYDVGERWEADITFAKLIANGAFSDWKSDPAAFFERLVETLKRDGEFKARNEVGNRMLAVHDRLLGDDLILTMQKDITEQVHAEARITFLANHDTLTELPNRASLNAMLDNRIENARACHAKLGLLLVDVDRFKDINDVFGHAAGDAVLSEISRRFLACRGEDDIAARLGGDEFCFLSPSDNQPEAAEMLAHRLLEAAREPVLFEGRQLKVGLSIGISIFPQNGMDRGALLAAADAALYRAKAEGRGMVRMFEPEMDERIHDQRMLQHDLQRAIDCDELELYYQPQARITGEIYGFEALIRWRHPTRGLLSPNVFIPIAEECGLILEIGEWVLRTACRNAVTWAAPLQISVNLSPVQFRHDDLSTTVLQILMETGLSPERLELEITENVLVKDFARALQTLRSLKKLGVHIAMDDFGTGYSSLSYLQSFPFDTLKIDRSFISRLNTDHLTDAIVRAVIGLGRGLDVPIVAEGVETEEQRAFLAGEHCQNIQGFLIGRPQEIGDYADIVGIECKPQRSLRRSAKTG
ncbi:putative bifunctional diguanylate cyclase/phosphodiesterase [Rhizobium halophytocola]|uniref:Diguanylate cyclase (GGDEF)-like protein n=1 Tax=Rhizobium halophytocola TaxID=735519 RepID=A0ABS4DWY4_9HYPH|nr:EAL domain-containing protein [Rhizobium halophytocola]MBP1850192.1 diguanylate cyclase (GGDEF)-like protein [Rhizobium halophytocola]